ncbi:hypothetical protein KSI01_19510 [Kurthia sibirica]|uniref:GyrI-like small molecule binding domain-containing protein n=2 Tax=Kurthia sibirica TaxID=202750 RepID=A0A2U3ALC7_9BACL|nr:GyrI-like domain-containing protein [Kurthia sibirica]PWI25336.1 hypothetical protein DEX24_08320 [Kurthia sibirica]GEK34418.1 hypothetical protein KSI01_19510 [Kurthia sibirica]
MPKAIQQTWQQVFTVILPANNWQIALPIQIEYYPPNFTGNDTDVCEIWIPIV